MFNTVLVEDNVSYRENPLGRISYIQVWLVSICIVQATALLVTFTIPAC